MTQPHVPRPGDERLRPPAPPKPAEAPSPGEADPKLLKPEKLVAHPSHADMTPSEMATTTLTPPAKAGSFGSRFAGLIPGYRKLAGVRGSEAANPPTPPTENRPPRPAEPDRQEPGASAGPSRPQAPRGGATRPSESDRQEPRDGEEAKAADAGAPPRPSEPKQSPPEQEPGVEQPQAHENPQGTQPGEEPRDERRKQTYDASSGSWIYNDGTREPKSPWWKDDKWSKLDGNPDDHFFKPGEAKNKPREAGEWVDPLRPKESAQDPLLRNFFKELGRVVKDSIELDWKNGMDDLIDQIAAEATPYKSAAELAADPNWQAEESARRIAAHQAKMEAKAKEQAAQEAKVTATTEAKEAREARETKAAADTEAKAAATAEQQAAEATKQEAAQQATEQQVEQQEATAGAESVEAAREAVAAAHAQTATTATETEETAAPGPGRRAPQYFSVTREGDNLVMVDGEDYDQEAPVMSGPLVGSVGRPGAVPRRVIMDMGPQNEDETSAAGPATYEDLDPVGAQRARAAVTASFDQQAAQSAAAGHRAATEAAVAATTPATAQQPLGEATDMAAAGETTAGAPPSPPQPIDTATPTRPSGWQAPGATQPSAPGAAQPLRPPRPPRPAGAHRPPSAPSAPTETDPAAPISEPYPRVNPAAAAEGEGPQAPPVARASRVRNAAPTRGNSQAQRTRYSPAAQPGWQAHHRRLREFSRQRTQVHTRPGATPGVRSVIDDEGRSGRVLVPKSGGGLASKLGTGALIGGGVARDVTLGTMGRLMEGKVNIEKRTRKMFKYNVPVTYGDPSKGGETRYVNVSIFIPKALAIPLATMKAASPLYK